MSRYTEIDSRYFVPGRTKEEVARNERLVMEAIDNRRVENGYTRRVSDNLSADTIEHRRLEARMVHLDKIVEEGKRLAALLAEISARHDIVLAEVTAMLMADGRSKRDCEQLASLVTFPTIMDTDKI